MNCWWLFHGNVTVIGETTWHRRLLFIIINWWSHREGYSDCHEYNMIKKYNEWIDFCCVYRVTAVCVCVCGRLENRFIRFIACSLVRQSARCMNRNTITKWHNDDRRWREYVVMSLSCSIVKYRTEWCRGRRRRTQCIADGSLWQVLFMWFSKNNFRFDPYVREFVQQRAAIGRSG